MRRGLPALLGLTACVLGFLGACARLDLHREEIQGARTGSDALALAEQDLDRAKGTLSVRTAARHFYSAAGRASSILFGPEPTDATQQERARQIHNEALGRFLRLTKGGQRNLDSTWRADQADQGIAIDLRVDGAIWHPETFDRLEFASDHSTRPLREVFKEDGLGVRMFAVRRRRSYDSDRLKTPDRFLTPIEANPVTLIVRAQDPGTTPTLEVLDPIRSSAVAAPNGALPLAMDLSTSLAYQFSLLRQPISEMILSLNPNYLHWSAGLHMLHPYEPGKIPIVFIHGYGTSPLCWIQTVNELRGDPAIRERYQFWIFTHPAMNSYLHSASILRRSLRELRATFDPNHADPAQGQVLLAGHSLGGLLAKTLIQDSGDQLWSLISPRPLAEIQATPEQRALLEDVLFLRPEPQVTRVVFLSTPHRGTSISNRRFGRISARLTPNPGPLGQTLRDLEASNPNENFTTDFLKKGFSTGFDQAYIGDPILDRLDRIPFTPGVATHSIIGHKHNGPIEDSNDGLVTYRSMHIDQVKSELVIKHHHFLQGEPETITELKRIMSEHAGIRF